MSLDLARRILAINVLEAGFGRATSATNVTASNTIGLEGDNERTITATADGATWTLTFGTAMNGLAEGFYTLSIGFSVEAGTVPVVIYASERAVPMGLPPGRHVVNVPFYYDPANAGNQRVGVTANGMFNGTTIRTGTLRVASGLDNQQLGRTELYGPDIPTTGTHRKGDLWRHSDPASGEPVGAVCTVSGTPGTWLPFGIVALLTAANTWTAKQTFSSSAGTDFLRAATYEIRVGNTAPTITAGTDLGRVIGYSGDATAPGAGDAASIRFRQPGSSPHAEIWFYTNRNDVAALGLTTAGGVVAPALPTHADEAAAVAAGLATGTLYKTATGEVRVKL